MTTKTVEEVVLDHDQAILLLRVIPQDKQFDEMLPEQKAAIIHYASCKECRKMGLGKILDYKISHQETLLVWAASSSTLWNSMQSETIKEQLATEHIRGRYELGNDRSGPDYNASSSCKEEACSRLRRHWSEAPISLFYDGDKEGAGELPLIISLFAEEQWPLEELLEIQKTHLHNLLENLPDTHRTSVEANIAALQKLALT